MFQMVRAEPSLPQVVAYYTFDEVKRDAAALPSPWILLQKTDKEVVVGIVENDIVEKKVVISSDFTVNVSVRQFPAKVECMNIEGTRLVVFLKQLQQMNVCPGIATPDLQQYAKLPNGQRNQIYFQHVTYTNEEVPNCRTTVRSAQCHWLQKETEPCKPCTHANSLLIKKQERAIANAARPLHINEPLSAQSLDKLKASFISERKHCRKVQKELTKFKQTLANKKRTVGVAEEMHNSLKSVLENSTQSQMQPLQKLFWEEQLKAFSCNNKKSMRWHPTMIRLAILIHSRSPAAYETLRKTGVLHLPGNSTLQDYTNVSSPSEGFTSAAVDAIKAATQDLPDHDRFVVLMHDEMSIQSDLVFDKRTGKLVGFIKSQVEQKQLATHVLVFYVVGVSSNLSASMGYFGTQTATSDRLFPLFWKAVCVLERACKLKVIASVSDKGTPNQRLYSMHGSDKDTVCYKTKNLYARDREIFFISDPPHLMKTLRNNLSNSGSNKNSKYLWKNGQHILWQHISNVYQNDCKQQLRATKLTAEHVFLTPRSVMNVHLAVQVLSESVGKILQNQGGPECQETAKFVLMMDKFFDCMNTRAKNEGMRKKKPNLEPYFDKNDERFDFFDELLTYLTDWKESIQERVGFSTSEKSRMFLSLQTFKGLYMTLKAFPEAVRYLLSQGVEFVLSNRFCQDPLERHFGRHRGIGRRSDNPSMWSFGYAENKLRLQRELAHVFQPKGNVAQKRPAEIPALSSSPMKKKKRH